MKITAEEMELILAALQDYSITLTGKPRCKGREVKVRALMRYLKATQTK